MDVQGRSDFRSAHHEEESPDAGIDEDEDLAAVSEGESDDTADAEDHEDDGGDGDDPRVLGDVLEVLTMKRRAPMQE